eukprot:CAMPEP_0183722948 /NCGR_PEP_ID=MMETSP0737-20130205/14736_1 /TAXON_ID=385413 /ORGANISM="Thalassiosira miniscula, Strain CCMP1093" /LENGTH=447 /DNA_ID=CAMNT_0025953195 /DNA_START=99 /DNA_END=1439 /DNA_ORIENTATION=+
MSQQNNNSVTSGGSVDKPNNHPNEIPIIDLANPDTALLQQQLYEACSTWGFFQLINHGISPELIASFRTAMANFFALPYDIKLPLKRNARNARGYFDDELTKRKRDWKEAIDVGEPGSRDWNLPDAHETNACLDGYNQFPSSQDCPHFRDVVVQYFEECAKLSNTLAIWMTMALSGGKEDEEELFLERMRECHTSYLRMNYYPPSDGNHCGNDSATQSTTTAADENDSANANRNDGGNNNNKNLHNNSFSNKSSADEGTLGISPHRDAGFLTILLQDDDCHSLQVARFEDDDHLDDGDRWVTVHPVPGSLTINTGDMAMICSNGRFRAPLHRVLTNTTKVRYSAPFFYNPGYEELISPFDCCYRGKDGGDNLVGKDGVTDIVTNNTSHSNNRSSSQDLQSLKYHPCLWGYFRALRFAGDLTDLGVEIQTSHFKAEGTSKSSHIDTQK